MLNCGSHGQRPWHWVLIFKPWQCRSGQCEDPVFLRHNKEFSFSLRNSLSPYSLYSPSMWTVYLGKLLLNRSSPTEEVARVQQIHLHHYYDGETNDYDLALLKLDRPAPAVRAGGAWPACLPPPTHQLEPDLLCWVTGWGSLQEGGVNSDKQIKCQNQAFILQCRTSQDSWVLKCNVLKCNFSRSMLDYVLSGLCHLHPKEKSEMCLLAKIFFKGSGFGWLLQQK